MFNDALKNFIKNDDNKKLIPKESIQKEEKEKKEPEVKHKLNIDMFEKNIKKNENPKVENNNKPVNAQKENVEPPKVMTMAERMKLFESKGKSNTNNQTKPLDTIGTVKKVTIFEKQGKHEPPVKEEVRAEISKNKTNLIEERLNNLNKNQPKEVEKPKEIVYEAPKVAPSFAERMKFLQNNANKTNQTKPPINVGNTNKVAMFEKPQPIPEPKKEEPVKMGSFEERQQQMRARLMTIPGMGMMKCPELKKEVTEQDKETNKEEITLHKAVENIQNKPVRKIRRKTMAPKFNFDGK